MSNKIKAYTRTIMASKIFRSARDQASIIAAINDPVNKELVTQLAEYVDDEYADLLVQETEPIEDTDTDTADSNEIGEGNGDTDDIRDADAPTPLSVKHGDALHELDESMPPPEMGDEPVSDDVQDSMPDDANASTNVDRDPITADTSITPKASSVSFAGLAGEIKGTLNARNDTAGVVRVVVKKDEEVWIYYSDSINLNVVMEPVIRVIDSMYCHLDFNRLARTDNAIIFIIETNEA